MGRCIAETSGTDACVAVSPACSAIKEIERALQQSDLGLTPSNDGNVIRLTIPQLTQDRRKELSKLVGKLTEEGKVALRNVRRDALKELDKLEKEKALSEDALKAHQDAIQKLTDKFVKQVDDLADSKNKELMQV
jgi:ribosome recycling factor